MIKFFFNTTLSIVIFFILSLPSHAIKLEKNNYYSGTLKDNNRNNIPLPPGEWLLTEININKPKGRSLGSFIEYTFYNSNVGYVFYFGPKGTKGSADRWSGNKTPSMCDGSSIVGKTNIRGKNNTEWCVFDDGEFIEFRNYTAQNYIQYYHTYYIIKSLLRDTSRSSLQAIGTGIFDQVTKNKAGNLSFLSNRLNFNRSSSFSSSDSTIIENNLKSNDETKDNLMTLNSSPKNRLKELKKMLDEGLISQEQYDKKSTEILEEF